MALEQGNSGLQGLDPMILAMLQGRPAPPMAQGFPPNTGPGTVTPDQASTSSGIPAVDRSVAAVGSALRGPADATGQGTPPVVPDPMGAGNPPTGATPVTAGTSVVPPPALPAPQSPQNSGATPEGNSSSAPQDITPNPTTLKAEPAGAPENPSDRTPGGRVAPPQDNQGGLGKALSGLGAIKPPGLPPPLPTHIMSPPGHASPAAPHPASIHHQSNVAPLAQQPMDLVKALQARHTLGQALRGHQYA